MTNRHAAIVTEAMAKAGAIELRERFYGERLEEVVTDVFYAMQGAIGDDSPDSPLGGIAAKEGD